MAKESGIGMTVTIDDANGSGVAITNDITNLTFNTTRGVQDVTGLDKTGMERLLLHSDFTLSLSFVYNDDAVSAWTVFNTFTDNDTRTVVIVHSGKTMTAECVLTSVAWARNADGSFGGTAELALANGTSAAWS